MDIKAFKMDGLGNDFVIIDQRSQDFNLNKDQIIKVCDRSFIGCDQLILIKKNKEIDADVEFYNSDGSASGACGNGTRCVADFLSKESGKKEITLLTASGSLKSKILGSNLVETEIGIPKVTWEEIPLSRCQWRFKRRSLYGLGLANPIHRQYFTDFCELICSAES